MNIRSITLVLAGFALAACSTNNNTKTESQLPRTEIAPAMKFEVKQPVEVAKGDLLEAILHLRKVHFAYNSAELLPPVRASLKEGAERLRQHPEVELYIDGHTDERGTEAYNMALGDRRAKVVKDFLVQMGVAPTRLHVVTFGEESPAASGATNEAYARNRRAEFRLMKGAVRLVVDEGVILSDTGRPLASGPAALPEGAVSVRD